MSKNYSDEQERLRKLNPQQFVVASWQKLGATVKPQPEQKSDEEAKIERAAAEMVAYEQALEDANKHQEPQELGGSVRSDMISDHERLQRSLRTVEITADSDPTDLQQKIAALRAAEVEKHAIGEIVRGIGAFYRLNPYLAGMDQELYPNLMEPRAQQTIWAESRQILRLDEICKELDRLIAGIRVEKARKLQVLKDTVRTSHSRTEYDARWDDEVNELMRGYSELFSKLDAGLPHLEAAAKFYGDIMNRKIHERDVRLSEIPPAIKKLEEIDAQLCALSQKITPLIAKARKLYQTTSWLSDEKDSAEFKVVEKVAKVLAEIEQKRQLFDTIIAGIRSIEPQTRTPSCPVSARDLFLSLPAGQQKIIRKLIDST